MAKKSDNEFSRSRNFRELDEALKKSFIGIKDDMTSLKENIHQQGVKIAEAKQNVKDNKADFVTIDKFNILKIRLGELNENVKKVWDIDKKLEDLDRKSVSASEFDKHTVAIENEVAKLKQDLEGLGETTTSEEQTKDLVEDVNDEFNNVKKGIEELRSIKDAITRTELDKRTNKLNKQADNIKNDFDKLKSEVKTKIGTGQVESLVDDINSEFDTLKELMAKIKEGETKFALSVDVDKQLDKIKKSLKEISEITDDAIDDFTKGVESSFKDFTKSNDKQHDLLSRQTDKIENKLADRIKSLKDVTAGKVTDLKKDIKTLVTKKQVENLVTDLNKEFDTVKDNSNNNAKDITTLNKNCATKSELTAESSKIKTTIENLSNSLKSLKKESATKVETNEIFEELTENVIETNKSLKDRFTDLVKRMKSDSDDLGKRIKSNSQDLDSVAKDVKKELKSVAYKDDLDEELDSIQDAFSKLSEKIDKIEGGMLIRSDLKDIDKRIKNLAATTKDEFVSNDQFDRLANTVGFLQEELIDQKELLAEKKKEMKAYEKELKITRRAEKKLAKLEVKTAKQISRDSKKSKKKAKKPGIPYRKSSFLANFMIGSAFIILLGAIAFFFNGLTSITDTFAIAAVICFVIGIIMRVVIAFKKT